MTSMDTGVEVRENWGKVTYTHLFRLKKIAQTYFMKRALQG